MPCFRRTLTVTAADGVSVTQYAYQGNKVTVTEPDPQAGSDNTKGEQKP